MLKRLTVPFAMLAAVGGSLFVGVAPAAAAPATCTSIAYYQDAQVPATSSGSVNCQLRQGNRGTAVSQLQNTLALCGGFLPWDGIDGDFGTDTKAALQRAQRAGGVSADGIYGPNTRRAIKHQSASGVSCRDIS